ncbi:MAG: hypothetical protein JO051_06980 [Acidobacteriaceae bacterium]|jgi:hypothetical protein|nr:hypothetical protein [Acidobacteriaceae bacterium]
MTRDTNRRAVMGAVLAAGAIAAVPSRGAPANLGVQPELQALIAVWEDAHRRLLDAYEASCAASERARCPVPKVLIASESDASLWCGAVVGKAYRETDVKALRNLLPLRRPKVFPDGLLPGTDFDARANEIITAWDRWQAEQVAAQEREDVAKAEARHSEAVDAYHEIGSQVAKLRANTMAGVIAKLLAAAPIITPDELEEDAHLSILVGAALDAAILANVPVLEESA